MAKQNLLTKEEIRERTDLAEVIGAHVALKSVGRKLRGLCPFHAEKTPSFYVDPDKGLWHCFGCKAGGDVFRFVELNAGLSFPEAAQWLARRLGGEFRQRSRAEHSQTQSLAEINSVAAAFYRRLLFADEGRAARAYLEERRLSSQDAMRFGLGYAPGEWSRLYDHLRDKGYSAQDIIRSGLCVSRASGGAYDRFRNRLIFPILDAQERTVAFGGRALAAEDEPKYLNSPESPLFVKGRLLYGISWAGRAIAEKSRALFVEGYFDLIRCHLCGFVEAVATLGTALTPAHLELLRRRRTEKVYLAFDADSAGLQAALRSRELAGAADLKILAVRLPAGQDPDSFLLQEGAAALEAALGEAQPLIELALQEILDKYEGSPANERLEVLKAGAEVLAGLDDNVERDFYISWLAERYCGPDGGKIGKVEQIIMGRITAAKRRPAGARRPAAQADRRPTQELSQQVSEAAPQTRLERQALSCLLDKPSILLENPELFAPEDFCEPDICRLARKMQDLAKEGVEPTGDRLSLSFEEPRLRELIATLSLSAEPWMGPPELGKVLERLRTSRVEKRRRELSLALEKEKVEAKRQQLLSEIHALARERSRQVGRRVVGE